MGARVRRSGRAVDEEEDGGACKSVILGRNKTLKIFVVVVAVAFCG